MASAREQNSTSPAGGRVFGQYLLALLLLALLQAPRLASSLEDLSTVFPPAARLASLLTLAAEGSGLSRFGDTLSAALTLFSTEKKAGNLSPPPEVPLLQAGAAPPAAPSPLPPLVRTMLPPQPAPAPPSRLSVSRTAPPSSVPAPALTASEAAPGGGESPAFPVPEQVSAQALSPAAVAGGPSASALSFRTVVSLSVPSAPPEPSASSAAAIRRRPRAADPPPAPLLFRQSAPAAELSASGPPSGLLVPSPPLRPCLPAPDSARALLRQAPFPASGGDCGRSFPQQTSTLFPAPPKAGRPDDAFHILLIGDSMMMEGLGPALIRALRDRGKVIISREARYSTGLSRRDYFDWPLHMAALADLHAPDLVVIALGGNDAQDIVDVTRKRHRVGTPSWEKHYLLRAGELIAAARKGGALVLWIGLPVMGNSPHAGYTLQISRQQQMACSDPSSQVFVDTRPILADAKGGFLTYAQNAKGVQTRIRQKDRIHVTDAGGELLAAAVLPHIDALLQKIAGQRQAALLDSRTLPGRRAEDPALAVTSRGIPSDGSPVSSPRPFRTSPGDFASFPPSPENDAPFPFRPAGAASRLPGG